MVTIILPNGKIAKDLAEARSISGTFLLWHGHPAEPGGQPTEETQQHLGPVCVIFVVMDSLSARRFPMRVPQRIFSLGFEDAPFGRNWVAEGGPQRQLWLWEQTSEDGARQDGASRAGTRGAGVPG